MCVDGLTGPQGAFFIGRLIAEGEDEIEIWGIRPLELRNVLGTKD